MKILISQRYMNYIQIGFISVSCLSTQLPPQAASVGRIKSYVDSIRRNTTLTSLRINYNANGGDALRRDTIFYVYGTDFPCSAILSYNETHLVRIKETVRTGSRISVYQYYLRDNRLFFAEEKEVACRFGQESPKIRYSEKDYLIHNKYYIAGDSCLAKEERGKSIFAGQFRLVPSEQHTRCGFFVWQAARYVTLFGHQPNRH